MFLYAYEAVFALRMASKSGFIRPCTIFLKTIAIKLDCTKSDTTRFQCKGNNYAETNLDAIAKNSIDWQMKPKTIIPFYLIPALISSTQRGKNSRQTRKWLDPMLL